MMGFRGLGDTNCLCGMGIEGQTLSRQRMVGLQCLSRKRLLEQVCDFRQYSGIAIS
jgi:hypothetical protein